MLCIVRIGRRCLTVFICAANRGLCIAHLNVAVCRGLCLRNLAVLNLLFLNLRRYLRSPRYLPARVRRVITVLVENLMSVIVLLSRIVQAIREDASEDRIVLLAHTISDVRL